MRSSGLQSQSAEQLLSKLQRDVRELSDRREVLEGAIGEREAHLEKLMSWEGSDRMTTEDDVRAKRDQVRAMEDQVSRLQERLEAALERNTKLVVFRQASNMALKKLREREDEWEKLGEEHRRILKQTEDKESEMRSQGKGGAAGKMGKRDLKKYGAVVRDKIEKYKRMRDELSSVRAELVTLQRTEQILKSRNKNLDEFIVDLERKRGVQGFRDTQRSLVDMAEKTAEVDQMKGATLEQISSMVEHIGREFKSKQQTLQPLMVELKGLRQQHNDVEAEYLERKSTYDKVAVGLEMEKASLERECDSFQDECLREESRFHHLNSQTFIAKIKLDRAEQEKKWQAGDGRMIRDFAHFKDLYAHKLTQQEQLTKALRKKQKELKENSGVMSNQKTNFLVSAGPPFACSSPSLPLSRGFSSHPLFLSMLSPQIRKSIKQTEPSNAASDQAADRARPAGAHNGANRRWRRRGYRGHCTGEGLVRGGTAACFSLFSLVMRTSYKW